MSAVATETTCLGDTSMYSIWLGARLRERVPVARRDPLGGEVAVVVERRVRLRDDVLLLLVGRHVVDLVGHDGRIGKAWAFCFLSSAMAAASNGLPALRTTSPVLATRSAPAS